MCFSDERRGIVGCIINGGDRSAEHGWEPQKLLIVLNLLGLCLSRKSSLEWCEWTEQQIIVMCSSSRFIRTSEILITGAPIIFHSSAEFNIK